MVLRKRILLDAFKTSPQGVMPGASKLEQSKVAPSAAAPIAAPAPRDSNGGPFAKSSASSPGRGSRPRTGFLARAFSDRVVQVAFVLFVIGIGLSYWLGRKSASEVSAAPHTGDVASTSGALVRPALEKPIERASSELAELNQKTAANGTVHERAFMDKANKYTLRLIQYKNDEAGLKAARATCDALRTREGLPVVGPISSGDILLVCAGAATKVADLDSLRAYVRELRGPTSNKNALPFADAYVVNIDDVIGR